MANILICQKCGSTISEKFIKFHQLLKIKKEKNEDITDNRDIFKQLNIIDKCCKITILTSYADKNLVI